ncbi:alpha/beta-hydrolase [Calocera cornea HHB12733]|uniref:Alpha/beta-hydrolase n=1 Tax=Calocera cornea HHB12733 TaxID=1353952 RepID=A0A165JJX0_9BASI|nr:alpha/beta-hydrolase [Calocera cornea HHB12733]
MNTTSGTFGISGVLCTPTAGDKHNGSVQLLVHGIGFDASYWDFAYQPETYSYVQAAASAGWTTFRYDRLGTGMSEHPSDGFRMVQAPTDLAILEEITSMLRSSGVHKIVGVGHSYGSEQLAALSGKNTSAVDALVLTGFSANSSSTGVFLAGGLYTRAADVMPSSFGSLPGSYVMTGLPQGNQFQFFYYPYFDNAAFAQARASEQPATLGVFSTMGVLGGSASNFTGPVHIVTGDRDLPFCGAQCDIVPVGMNKTILELTQDMVFPMSSNFSIYSPANTGHGVNLHYSAPETYKEIMTFLESM